jgi:hypothetical protein
MADIPSKARVVAALASADARSSTRGDVVRFGLPRNYGQTPVTFTKEQFEALSDEEAASQLRQEWRL